MADKSTNNEVRYDVVVEYRNGREETFPDVSYERRVEIELSLADDLNVEEIRPHAR